MNQQSTIKLTLSCQMMALLRFWCLILLISGFVASQDSSSSSASSSSSNSGSKVQQVSTATIPETPYQLSSWEVFSSEIKLIAGIIQDPNACRQEIMDKTHNCYNEYKEKWDNGGTEKKFCCFAQDVLDCFYDLVPTYCDKKGTEAYLSPEKQQLMYFSASKDACGNYHSFWHCDNGIPIVVGATCGAILVIALIIGGVIFFLRKRKGSSSLSRGDNL